MILLSILFHGLHISDIGTRILLTRSLRSQTRNIMSYLKIGTIKPGDLQFMTGINMRSFLRGLFKLLFQLLTRIDNVGMDNLPEHGAFILVSNHLSLVDSILVFVLLNRQDATGFVAKKHQKNFGEDAVRILPQRKMKRSRFYMATCPNSSTRRFHLLWPA